jgi:hypothetical protein
MPNKPEMRPSAAVAPLKHDAFRDWLIPPVMIPVLLALAVVAYVFYQAAA